MDTILRKWRGFTLIEMIFVILIISIVGVYVVVQLPTTRLGLGYEGRRLLNDMRYVQALSMMTGLRHSWVRLSATSYRIVNENGATIPFASGTNQVNFSSGITFGAFNNLPNNSITFDSQGIPYSTTAIPGTPLTAIATIVLQAGTSSVTLSIAPQTGFGALS